MHEYVEIGSLPGSRKFQRMLDEILYRLRYDGFTWVKAEAVPFPDLVAEAEDLGLTRSRIEHVTDRVARPYIQTTIAFSYDVRGDLALQRAIRWMHDKQRRLNCFYDDLSELEWNVMRRTFSGGLRWLRCSPIRQKGGFHPFGVVDVWQDPARHRQLY